MNQKVIKELQKLMGLCVEISSRTEHDVFFDYSGHINTFEIHVYEYGWMAEKDPDRITSMIGDNLNFRNINKCRQKLLKYKEW